MHSAHSNSPGETKASAEQSLDTIKALWSALATSILLFPVTLLPGMVFMPAQRDRFEPPLYKPGHCSTQTSQFTSDVKTLLPVVDELNLKLRIWSKS